MKGSYRFNIGGLAAAVVSDGPLLLPAAPSIFPEVAADVLAAHLQDHRLPIDAVTVAQNCLLVDIGGHWALIDNGMGSSQLLGDQAGRLMASLAEQAVAPEAIAALVLTHAHMDHCWGTMRDDGLPAFPKARIYISGTEWDYWTGPRWQDGSRSAAGFASQLWPLRDRVTRIMDGEEFLPGIHAMATPGHTPGHLSLRIVSGGSELICAADVAFHPVLSFALPGAHSAYDADRVQGAATRLALLARLAREGTLVLHYHAPWPGLGRVRAEGAAFRWVAESLAL